MGIFTIFNPVSVFCSHYSSQLNCELAMKMYFHIPPYNCNCVEKKNHGSHGNPEYTSSCAITQKIKATNVRVVKISECTPNPKIQLGSITFENLTMCITTATFSFREVTFRLMGHSKYFFSFFFPVFILVMPYCRCV